MLEKVDVLYPPISQYGALHHFTRKIIDALKRVGIKVRVYGEDGPVDPKTFLDDLWKNPPDCTLSFNGLLPDKDGRFLCDEVKIPHVGCFVDSPINFFPIAKSTHTIVASDDRVFCDFFKTMLCPNVLFFPHAAEADIVIDPDQTRDIDVAFFGSFIDFEEVREEWYKHYPQVLSQLLDEAAEMTLADQTTSYIEAFTKSVDKYYQLGKINPETIPHLEALKCLENYIRGKERYEILNSIKSSKVHIFGNSISKMTWAESPLHDHPNLIIHDSVSFDDAIDLMKRSKIVINSSPSLKNGGHERIFTGLACGALVITNETKYLDEYFTDEHDISFYHHNKIGDIDAKINAYLNDENKRSTVAEEGRKIVMTHHTWDNRVNALKHLLPPILKQLPKRT